MECFDYTDKVRSDKTGERVYYADLSKTLKQLQERAIVFVPTLALMDDCVKAAENGQRKICCLWSPNNERKMNEEQLRVLESLLKHERIPEDIDLLINNAAYEASINIHNEDFRVVIIHTSSTDVQVQVRGRLRHDIDKLYIYDKAHIHVAHLFPEEYLNTLLTVEQVREIAVQMNLRNPDGRLLLWPSVYKLLEKDGMIAHTIRVKNKSVWSVRKL